jgi:hypothetical protein
MAAPTPQILDFDPLARTLTTLTATAFLLTTNQIPCVANSHARIDCLDVGDPFSEGYIFEYDPRTNGLTRKASRTLRFGQACALAGNGRIECFGGQALGGSAPVPEIWEYDPVADTLVMKISALPPQTGLVNGLACYPLPTGS